jgi:hypothetical protein
MICITSATFIRTTLIDNRHGEFALERPRLLHAARIRRNTVKLSPRIEVIDHHRAANKWSTDVEKP